MAPESSEGVLRLFGLDSARVRSPTSGGQLDDCLEGATGAPVRLAAYTDYVYKQRDGAVYAQRAFALFLARLGSGGGVARDHGAARP